LVGLTALLFMLTSFLPAIATLLYLIIFAPHFYSWVDVYRALMMFLLLAVCIVLSLGMVNPLDTFRKERNLEYRGVSASLKRTHSRRFCS